MTEATALNDDDDWAPEDLRNLGEAESIHVADKLNGEVERLIAKITESKDAITRWSKACVTDEEKALADAWTQMGWEIIVAK